VFVPQSSAAAETLRRAAAELGVRCSALATAPAGPAHELGSGRIGLFDTWGGSMAVGWTEWTLASQEFPVELVFGERVERGDLRRDFDVLVFHDGLPDATRREQRDRALRNAGRDVAAEDSVEKLRAALPPFEDWSTMEARRVRTTDERAIPALRAF